MAYLNLGTHAGCSSNNIASRTATSIPAALQFKQGRKIKTAPLQLFYLVQETQNRNGEEITNPGGGEGKKSGRVWWQQAPKRSGTASLGEMGGEDGEQVEIGVNGFQFGLDGRCCWAWMDGRPTG